MTSGFIWSQSIKRSTIGSIGNTIEGKTVKVNQSVGQVSVHSTLSNGETMIRQGFQQPLNTIKSTDANSLQVNVFPNPNTGKFNVSILSPREGTFSYQLVTLSGQTIHFGTADSSFFQVNVAEKVIKGTYILKVHSEDGMCTQHKLVML